MISPTPLQCCVNTYAKAGHVIPQGQRNSTVAGLRMWCPIISIFSDCVTAPRRDCTGEFAAARCLLPPNRQVDACSDDRVEPRHREQRDG
jgi:hypothetical protein